MSETILLPLSGSADSTRAIPIALALAQRESLALHVLSCVEDQHQVADRRLYLRRVMAEHGVDAADPTISMESAVEPHAPRAIAARVRSDVVTIMATKLRLHPHDHHLGSAAEIVTRLSERPIMLVGPRCEIGAGLGVTRVLVPVDGSPLSEHAMAIGASWAERLEVPLWLTTVVSPAAERELEAAVHDDARVVESAYLHRLAHQLPESGYGTTRMRPVEWDVLHGDRPGIAIAEEARDDAVIVMSTHGRAGLSRLRMGSVTADVVRHARRPVVVWHPASPASKGHNDIL